jgi:hypothetical protein
MKKSFVYRATMEATCSPRQQQKKIWKISVHRSMMAYIVARRPYLATKLMKCTGSPTLFQQ